VKKIAFNLLGDSNWQAGFIYMTNLLRALQVTERNEVRLLLLGALDTYVPEELKNLIDETLVRPSYNRWTAAWFIDRMSKKLLHRDLLLDRFLRQHQVSVVAFDDPPRSSRIPSLSWLPDFQHVHLSEMFSLEECLARDRSFMCIAEKATKVLLLSESVKRDFEAFAPEHAHKARVLSPVTYIPTTTYEANTESIAELYHLPKKFIYLPNQFWKHKNHATVFQSVRLLKDKGTHVIVVCSGNPIDYRHPNYFSELLQMASRLRIRNQIIFLGLIPREHVFMLIRQSICVLNPSLFEGFGLTTEEAQSLGKLSLLSDIPVHREQNPPRAAFFQPKDHEDLANKLEEIWHNEPPGPDLRSESESRETLITRLRGFGESFISVVNEVIQ